MTLHYSSSAPPPHEVSVCLHANWSATGVQYIFQDAYGVLDDSVSSEDLPPDAKIRELLSCLSECCLVADTDEKRNARFRLEGHARWCFERVLPRSIQDRIRSLPRHSNLGISTNRDSVPWETLNDGERFLGTELFVYRIPRFREGYVLGVRAQGRKRSRRRPSMLTVLGGGLAKEARRIRESHFDLMGPANVAVIEQPTLVQLRDTCAAISTLYMYCHGHLEPVRLQVAASSEVESCLEVATAAQLDLREGSIVVLNACGALRVHGRLEAYGNFGWAFYRSGARAVLGTNAEIGVDEARLFGEVLLGQLAEKIRAGRVAGPRLIRQAFVQAKKSSEFADVNYCFYGAPSRVVLER